MTDIVSPETRSRMMSGIRGKNTQPEHHVRRLLHRRGFRFRLHAKNLPGKPDLVFPKYHAVIFVHGCFWHGHTCSLFRIPGVRQQFWTDKICRNRANDHVAVQALLDHEWRVAVVWECAIKGKSRIPDDVLADALTSWLKSDERMLTLRACPDGKEEPSAP